MNLTNLRIDKLIRTIFFIFFGTVFCSLPLLAADSPSSNSNNSVISDVLGYFDNYGNLQTSNKTEKGDQSETTGKPEKQFYSFVRSYGTSGHGTDQLMFPKGLAVSPNSKRLAVADSENNRVIIFKIILEENSEKQVAKKVHPSIENLQKHLEKLHPKNTGQPPHFPISLEFEKVIGDIWPWEGTNYPKDPPDAYREIDNSDGLTPPRALDGRAYHGGEARIRPANMVPMDHFNHPETLTWLDSEKLLVADTGNHRIKCVSISGEILWILGQEGWKDGYFHSPKGIDVDQEGKILVAEPRAKFIRGLGMDLLQRQRTQGNRLQIFNPDLTFKTALGHMHHMSGDFERQYKDLVRIRITPKGDYMLSDSGNNRVILLDGFFKTRKILEEWPYCTLHYPYGVDANEDGLMLICDTANNRVLILSDDGSVIYQILGCKGIMDGQFSLPREAKFGPKGFLFIADTGNCRIQIFKGPFQEKEQKPPEIIATPTPKFELPPDFPRSKPQESYDKNFF
ncbi:MAG: hypothetical protein HQM08_16150 [Candidatus Riflebacteria bacterium]|nr:hypothetical protein [Candidatus Riflebacteria bacterium]